MQSDRHSWLATPTHIFHVLYVGLYSSKHPGVSLSGTVRSRKEWDRRLHGSPWCRERERGRAGRASQPMRLSPRQRRQAGRARATPSRTSDRPPGVVPGRVEWGVPAPGLAARQGGATHWGLPQVAVGGAQPGPPWFCHTDTAAPHADGSSVTAPPAGRAADPPWFYQSRSRR
jgi:hypothetical protein